MASGSNAAIIANWRGDPHLLAFKDGFGRSARRWDIPPAAAAPAADGFVEKMRLLADLRDAAPRFFDLHDYGWAFDEDSYRDSEARDPGVADQNLRYQLTVLRTLAELWPVTSAIGGAGIDLAGICARYVVSPELSPACRASRGFRYLTVPFGFRRIALELLLAFRTAAHPSPGTAADMFRAMAAPPDPAVLKDFAYPFIARMLGTARSGDMAVQDAAERHLLTSCKPFAGTGIDVAASYAGSIESALLDLTMEWTANHELGHLLYGHSGRGAAADEYVADATGTDVSLLGWGWWADAGALTGLPDPVWCLLGPSVFFWMAECLLRIEEVAFAQSQPEADANRAVLASRRAAVAGRLRRMVHEVWPAFGVDVPPAALDLVRGFRTSLARVAEAFAPNPALLAAAAFGREELGVAIARS